MLEKVVVYISSAGTLLAFPGLFLYCIFEAQQNEKPRLWYQIGALLALGVYSLVFCWFSAQVRSIAPFELINRERRFFWDFFIKELEKNDSFSAAAQAMNFHLPEVEKFIQGIASDILLSGIVSLSAALVLLVAVVVMMVKSRKKKVAPWLLTGTVAASCVFGALGGHLSFFSSAIKHKLTWYSVLQTKILDECVREKKGEFRTNKEIAAQLPHYLKETPHAFGESWERLEKIFYVKTFSKSAQ